MSTYILGFFCPNFEDYEDLRPMPGAAVYPDMWPAERRAQKALFEQEQELKRHPLRGPVPDILSLSERPTIIRALVGMAEECGWRVKNLWNVRHNGVSPIYVTDEAADWKPVITKAKTKTKGMELDHRLLVDMMADLMPELAFMLIHGKDVIHGPADKRELCAFALSTLAKESGWQRNSEAHRHVGATVYKIS